MSRIVGAVKGELVAAIEGGQIGCDADYAEAFAQRHGLNPITVRSTMSRIRRNLGLSKYGQRKKATKADLRVLQDYLDWQYAIQGSFRTEEFHRRLVREQRHMPTLTEAREAIARLRS